MAKTKKAAKKKKAVKKKKVVKGPWTKVEIRILKKEFPNESCSEVAKKLDRPFYAVKRKAYRLGIYKSRAYLRSLGRT